MDYAYELPTDEQMGQLRAQLIDMTQRRQKVFDRVRAVLNGEFTPKFPVAAKYKAQVKHSWLMRGAVNEKVTRFKKQPQFQVTPRKNSRGNVSRESQEAASRMEQWFAAAMQIRDRGSSPIWTRHYEDIFTFFMACHRVEDIHNVAWPELIPDDKGEDLLGQQFKSAKAYERAKEEVKQRTFPFRTVYVPPDAVFPLYEDDDIPTLVMELERRSLAEVLRNPNYADSEFVSEVRRRGSMAMPQEKVTVLHLSNRAVHAYYALAPGDGFTERDRFPTGTELGRQSGGHPRLLYHYEHGLGRPVHNLMYGAFGSWSGETSSLEGRLNAAADLCEDADELVSQAATAVRNLYWPRFVHKVSAKNRDATDSKPRPVHVDEAEDVAIWDDEDYRQLIGGIDIGALQWLYEERVQTFRNLMGAAILYGQHQEGASTGYHEQVLMDQAKSLDALFEVGLAHGAIEWANIICKYILKLNEPVPAIIRPDKGRKMAEYLSLGPKDLNPWPIIDARVIAPKAADMAQMALTADRLLAPVGIEQKPLFSRQTVQSEFMAIASPDEEDRAVDIAMAEQNISQDPMASSVLARMFWSKVVEAEIPAGPTAEEYAGADPAAYQAMDMAMPEAGAMGGMDPNNLLATMGNVPQPGMGGAPVPPNLGMTQGLGGGLPTGMGQPEQVDGNTQRLMQGQF